MEAIFEEAGRLLAEGRAFVLATVVRTKGSTPQKPGAKLLVRQDGTAVGTLGGGCIEADVWAEAKVVLEEKGPARVRRFELNEDIAARDGLVCGGTMEILIDPVERQPRMAPLVAEILGAYRGKGNRALATLVELGEAPDSARAGAKLFIRADGSVAGTLGSPALDRQAVEAALELMPRGRNRWIEVAAGSPSRTPQRAIYVESFTTPPTAVIAGGGHVGRALYTMARFAGFRVVVIDDRPEFANKERFPEAEGIVVGDFDAGLRGMNMTTNHYCVIATRGHKLDDVALLEAARSGAGYVGLLGSRRKAMLIYRNLIREGVPEERVAQIRAPVGLNLGGRTPEEIAVSIVAEMVAVRNGADGSPMTMDREMVRKAKALAARPPPRGRKALPAGPDPG